MAANAAAFVDAHDDVGGPREPLLLGDAQHEQEPVVATLMVEMFRGARALEECLVCDDMVNTNSNSRPMPPAASIA